MDQPTHEYQVRFLADIQRILDEGKFTSTYKFALLHALMDLAVENGDDSGAALALRTSGIAEKFVEMYWRQTEIYPGTVESNTGILRQNSGQQAAVIRRIVEAREATDLTLARLKLDARAWEDLVGSVDDTVRGMPLRKLQRVGDEILDFLYEQRGRDRSIVLRPGVAFCLRKFRTLIADLVRGAWVRYVRKLNHSDLGEIQDLEEFLFGGDRAPLEAYRPILWEVQQGACFYCPGALRESSTQVDHFIPWSRYSLDLSHNFVLAHARCNAAKRNHLASEDHLARWVERNALYGQQLSRKFDGHGLPHHLSTTRSVACWAYRQAEEVGGQVWVEGNTLQKLTPAWRSILGNEETLSDTAPTWGAEPESPRQMRLLVAEEE